MCSCISRVHPPLDLHDTFLFNFAFTRDLKKLLQHHFNSDRLVTLAHIFIIIICEGLEFDKMTRALQFQRDNNKCLAQYEANVNCGFRRIA